MQAADMFAGTVREHIQACMLASLEVMHAHDGSMHLLWTCICLTCTRPAGLVIQCVHTCTCSHFLHAEVRQAQGWAYCVPARPSDKSKPKPFWTQDVTRADSQQHVRQDIKQQIKPLKNPFQHNQLDITPLPGLPERASFICRGDASHVRAFDGHMWCEHM